MHPFVLQNAVGKKNPHISQHIFRIRNKHLRKCFDCHGIVQEKKEGASGTPHRGEDCTYCLFFARVSRLVSGCEKEAVPSIYAA